jgi:hypothetical protein
MTDYDFIDPDRPERKREVQRRIEVKELDCDVDADKIVEELEQQENSSSTTEENNNDVNSDKVAEVNSGEEREAAPVGRPSDEKPIGGKEPTLLDYIKSFFV